MRLSNLENFITPRQQESKQDIQQLRGTLWSPLLKMEIGGLSLFLLGCEHLQERYKDAVALFEAAFNEPKVSRTLFSKEFDLFSCSIKGGRTQLQATLPTDLTLSYYPSEEPRFQAEVEWKAPTLPIPSGAVVGQVRVITDLGKTLVCMPLFAAQPVEASLRYRTELVWQTVKGKMGQRMGLLMAAIGLAIIGLTFYRFYHMKRAFRKG